MKFLIYGINFAPELTGIGKYTGELAASLAAQGHSVRVVSAPPYYPHWQVQPGYSATGYHKETWQGVEVLRCPLYVPARAGGFKRLAHLASFMLSSIPAMLAQLGWRADVVLTVAPAIFTAPLGLLVGRLCGAKTWLHIQDFELDAAFNLGILKASPLLLGCAAAAERFLLRRFDCVSTISRRMLDRLAQKGVPPARACSFPNWVDLDAIFPQQGPNAFREPLGLGGDELVALYSGNMGRKQGLEILAQVARQLQDTPGLRFIFCGEGVAKAELVAQTRGLDNVTFLPLQPLERLNDLLNLADIHLLPQRAGAADLVMPSKLTGMLASGRPVIAAAAQGTELYEVVSQVGLAVPPEDAAAMCAGLRALAADAPLRARLGKAGRAYAEQSCARSAIITAFLTQVTQLCGARRASSPRT